MNNDALKKIVAQGLGAMHAGAKMAARDTGEIQKHIKHPDLRAAFEGGNRVSEQWRVRIGKAVQAAGGSSEQTNPILEAHGEVGRKILEEASDDDARNLGMIAISQLALHYWIAAFGTMATYTKHLGMEEVAGEMKTSADEAKQGDERFTALAKSILGG